MKTTFENVFAAFSWKLNERIADSGLVNATYVSALICSWSNVEIMTMTRSLATSPSRANPFAAVGLNASRERDLSTLEFPPMIDRRIQTCRLTVTNPNPRTFRIVFRFLQNSCQIAFPGPYVLFLFFFRRVFSEKKSGN